MVCVKKFSSSVESMWMIISNKFYFVEVNLIKQSVKPMVLN